MLHLFSQELFYNPLREHNLEALFYL